MEQLMEMTFINKAEKEALETRLRSLYANRPVLSARIAEAKELGDLKENAEYHAARELQGLEEAEIRRLEERLSKVQVVEGGGTAKEAQVVFLGSLVKLREVDTGDEDVYRLVGEATGGSDDHIEVTVNSPMGEALMKARVGETITVRAPRGKKSFLVVELL